MFSSLQQQELALSTLFHLSNKPNDTSVTAIATLCYLLNINKVVEILWQFVLLYLRERINGQN